MKSITGRPVRGELEIDRTGTCKTCCNAFSCPFLYAANVPAIITPIAAVTDNTINVIVII